MTWEALIRGLALLAAACGIYLLQAAWRFRSSHPLRIWGGWGLVFASITLWGTTSGADKGVALGLIAVVLLVLALLGREALSSERREAKQSRGRVAETEKITGLKLLRKVWVGFLIGPISGLAALAISTAMFAVFKDLGLDHSINLTIVSFAFTLLWSGLSVFAGFEPRLLRKSLGVIGLGVLPLAYLISVA